MQRNSKGLGFFTAIGVRGLVVVALIILIKYFAVFATSSNLEKKEFIPPSKALVHLSFGFNEVYADLLWLRLIQNLDDCSRLFSDNLKSLVVDEIDEVSGRLRCKRSWTFRMLDAITDLAPRFRMPAVTGGISLSVLLDDYEGAKIIFDKAVKNFPNDWSILYRAAYHYLFDLNDRGRAAELMLAAAESGGPSWLRFSAARLMSEVGKADFGLKVLSDYLESVENKDEQKMILEKMDRIKTAIRQNDQSEG